MQKTPRGVDLKERWRCQFQTCDSATSETQNRWVGYESGTQEQRWAADTQLGGVTCKAIRPAEIGKGTSSSKTRDLRPGPWTCQCKEKEAASIWEEVAHDVEGWPEYCDILEFKRRTCLLEERGINRVNSAERLNQMKMENWALGLARGRLWAPSTSNFKGIRGGILSTENIGKPQW